MPRGDATGGRGYIEPGTVTEKKPNGDARAFSVPLGDNPYFPTPTPEPKQAGSDEETTAPDLETSEGGEPEVVQHAEPEPTFDTDTDRASGIDTDSPEYKHFQRAFTKARQRDKTDVEKQLEAMEAKLEASIVKRKLEEPVKDTPPEEAVVKLTFDGFPVPRLPEGSQLAGLEEEIVALFKPMAQAVINDVARQQQAAYQRMQAEQTKAKITQFVTEIEQSHPDKVSQVLTDLEEYSAVAKSNPDKWINFIKKSLGLNEEPQPVQPQPASAQRLVQKQQSAVPRPTSSNGVAAQPRAPKSTREAIEMALDAQLR